eukprot:1539118-Rhodomonas_salina.1
MSRTGHCVGPYGFQYWHCTLHRTIRAEQTALVQNTLRRTIGAELYQQTPAPCSTDWARDTRGRAEGTRTVPPTWYPHTLRQYRTRRSKCVGTWTFRSKCVCSHYASVPGIP